MGGERKQSAWITGDDHFPPTWRDLGRAELRCHYLESAYEIPGGITFKGWNLRESKSMRDPKKHVTKALR